MSNYRIAFLLCRSLSTFFFWNALFNVMSVGSAVMGVSSFSGLGFLSFLGFIAVGALLRFFASTISSTLTGVSAFEGESLSNSFQKEPNFRALTRACTGLLLLVFGVSQLFSTTIGMFTSYSFFLRGGGYSGYFQLALLYLLSPFLQIALGIYLAFGSQLKRLSQTISGVELASPDETASKSDSSS